MTKKQASKKTTQPQAQAKTSAKNNRPQIVTNNTKLQLKLKWNQIKTEHDRVLQQLAKKVKAKGFRQGKVPLKIAQEQIGRERLINQALENLLPKQYQDLIKKEQKQPLTQPEIKPLKMEWGQDWEFELQIAEKPALKLTGYQQAIKKGLQIAKKQKGKQDAQAKQAADKPSLTPEQEQAQEREIKLHQIFKALIEKIQPQVPELLLKQETRHEIRRLTQELERLGLSLDDYLQRRQLKFEEFSSQIAAEALGKIQLEFVLGAIEEAEKITVSKQDKKQALAKIKDEKVHQHITQHPHYARQLESQIKRQKLLDSFINLT